MLADELKLQLAKDGVCETIYRLLETYKTLANTNEARALMKLACDLIVLILTGGMIVPNFKPEKTNIRYDKHTLTLISLIR